MLMEKTENFIRRLRWKLFAIENPEVKNDQIKTFGFNTNNQPPASRKLSEFENDLFDMIKSIKFKPVSSEFQKKLREDIQKIKSTDELIVSADKSRNQYKITVPQYNKLLHENISKEYKKSSKSELHQTNKRATDITKQLKIADRVNKYTENDAFLTIKDHKPNFPSKVECRLINPAKSNIGKISKY